MATGDDGHGRFILVWLDTKKKMGLPYLTKVRLAALFIERAAVVFVSIFVFSLHSVSTTVEKWESWLTFILVLALLVSFIMSLSVLVLDVDDTSHPKKP